MKTSGIRTVWLIVVTLAFVVTVGLWTSTRGIVDDEYSFLGEKVVSGTKVAAILPISQEFTSNPAACVNQPIDAVYTWVNGSDPVFQETLARHTVTEGKFCIQS